MFELYINKEFIGYFNKAELEMTLWELYLSDITDITVKEYQYTEKNAA